MKDPKFIAGGLICLVLVFLFVGCQAAKGNGGYGFGEEKTLDVTVQTKHVDISGSGDSRSSHYMVTTDQGTFELDNGIFLVWNADELYGRLQEGQRYRIRVQGDRLVWFIFQQYPYVTEVEELKE